MLALRNRKMMVNLLKKNGSADLRTFRFVQAVAQAGSRNQGEVRGDWI